MKLTTLASQPMVSRVMTWPEREIFRPYHHTISTTDSTYNINDWPDKSMGNAIVLNLTQKAAGVEL